MEKSKSFYLKKNTIFLIILITNAVIIILLSSILYFNYRVDLIHKIVDSEIKNLSSSCYSAYDLSQKAKDIAISAFYDSNVTKLRIQNELEYTDHSDAYKKIANLTSLYYEILSIYIFTDNAEDIYSYSQNHYAFYTKDNFFDNQFLEIMSDFKAYPKLKPIVRNVPVKINQNAKDVYKAGYSFLFFDQPKSLTNISSGVMINISQDSLIQTINTVSNIPENSYTYVISENGQLVTSTYNNNLLDSLYEEDYVKKILTSGQNVGNFISKINNKKNLIIYMKYEPLNWFFIRTIAYDNLMHETNQMLINTISITIGILLIGIIISFIFSKKLYYPINEIIKRMKTLETLSVNQELQARDDFLRNLVIGNTVYNRDEIIKKHSSMNNELPIESNYRMFLVKVEDIEDSVEMLGDYKLINFAIINICSEHILEVSKNKGISLNKEDSVIIINSGDFALDSNILYDLAQKCQKSIYKYLKISVTIVFSEAFSNLLEVNTIYNNLQYSSNYRIYKGNSCIIDSEEIGEKFNYYYEYPKEKENKLIEALMAAIPSNVEESFEEIIQEAKNNSVEGFRLIMMQLYYNIKTSIEKQRNIVASANEKSYTQIFAEIMEASDLNRIINIFHAYFNGITEKINEANETRYDSIINLFEKLVKEFYMEQNLSLEYISEKMDISAGYLSRVVKQYLKISPIDYINNVRMEKAKELLINTNTRIDDIVDMVGYTNIQYFYRVFKNTYGITPKQLRNSYKNISN